MSVIAISNFISSLRERARCCNLRLGILAALAIVGATSHGWAEARSCDPSGLMDDKGAIWRALTPRNESDYWDHPCANSDTVCLAATELACAYHAMLSRDIPNSLGRGNTWSYGRDLPGCNAVIRSIGRKHPERVPIYCNLLAEIASMDEETPEGDRGVTLPTAELAARLSALGHKSCIKQVMAAFPHNVGMATIIAQARSECLANKYPGCAGITQPRP